MKLVDDNMRKIGLAVILAGLMVIILGFGKYFEESLKIATLTQNSMVDFKQYEILDGKINYKLPSGWLTQVKEDDESENNYLNEFVSEDAGTYGFIELIDNSKGIESVIDGSIKEIEGMGINDYSREQVKINEENVECIQYELISSKENVKKTYEYFIPYDGCLVKITFIISDKKTRENTEVVFENIVKTFNLKN